MSHICRSEKETTAGGTGDRRTRGTGGIAPLPLIRVVIGVVPLQVPVEPLTFDPVARFR